MRKIISGILAISITIILFAQGFYYCMRSLKNGIDSETAEVDASAVVVTYEASPAATAEEQETSGTLLRVFCETDEPLPDWWDPESAEVVYGETQPVQDIVALSWVPVILTGWDGWTMEEWEMDLFSRCFYLEFWGTSEYCCQAGCDAMLNLWTSGLYGRTMGESLSALNDFGKYVYSVYPDVWTTNYDAEGLAWCRDFCETRFQTGPTYQVMYFQLYGFHDPKWATPCFMSDGVYFSARKGY